MILNNSHLQGKKSEKKELEFDVFQNFVDTSVGQSKQKLCKPSNVYNFCINDGELKTGYGFKQLAMPTSTQNLDSEEIVGLDGDEIHAIWPFKWYDNTSQQNKYYLLAYNEKNRIAFANLFSTRPFELFATTLFSSTPVGSNTRYRDDEAMVFSNLKTNGIFLMTGSISKNYPEAPQLISVCSHFNKYFAITAGQHGKLLYTDERDITKWTSENMSQIDFDDNKGGLNKVMVLNDYVYVFRDFGINKISLYSTKNNFDISQLYQCDSYIYPKTIASSGDKIYFLEGSGIFSFNGSSASKVNLDCDQMLVKADKTNASAVCFEGKYYLACRYDFDDEQKIGCESQEGYINNCLFIFDLSGKKVNLLRGVDIKQLCVLNNPYKSKVVACFNGVNIGYVGELTKDGSVFDEATIKTWTSVKSDLGSPEKFKKTKYFTIKSSEACEVKIESERETKIYKIDGNKNLQRIKADVFGKELQISIKSTSAQTKISNIKLVYNVM